MVSRYKKSGGWFSESSRHSLSARGVKTGRKTAQLGVGLGKMVDYAKQGEGYGGWSNYATWAFKLHIDNNEGDYNYWRERTQESIDSSNNDKDDAIYKLSDELKDWYYEVRQSVYNKQGNELATSMMEDVGNGVDVDWTEIATSLVEEELLEDKYQKKKKK
jgi:hypothetical protein